MTAIHTLLNTGMYNKLVGNTNLATAAGSAIYDTYAPPGTTDNYVIFQIVAGGDTNTSPRRDVDVVYRVEFISMGLAAARAGAGYIDDALHDQALTLSGWSNYRMYADRLFQQDQIVGGKQYYRRGGFYRLMADKDG